MNLINVLPSYLNKNVEVFLGAGFYEGELVAVSDATITIKIGGGYYYGPSVEISIVIEQINYVRVLN